MGLCVEGEGQQLGGTGWWFTLRLQLHSHTQSVRLQVFFKGDGGGGAGGWSVGLTQVQSIPHLTEGGMPLLELSRPSFTHFCWPSLLTPAYLTLCTELLAPLPRLHPFLT